MRPKWRHVTNHSPSSTWSHTPPGIYAGIPLFLMGWVDKVAPKLEKTAFNINVSIEIISKWLQVLMSWQILFCQCPPKNSLTNIFWNIPTAVPPPQLALRVREQTVQKMELNRGGKTVTVSNGYDAESLLMLLYIYIYIYIYVIV